MKIVVLTDVHANLPALEAALRVIRAEGYDALYHTGDLIAIGPHPAECMALLLNTPDTFFIMGNHDAWFADGLTAPPPWMSEGEWQHQQWTHTCLNETLRIQAAQWPYLVQETFAGVTIRFLHYALDGSGRSWQPIVRQPSAADLDHLFAPDGADIVFFGHHHPFMDISGQARYINPGSLGCHREAAARYTVVTCQNGAYTVQHRAVAYDDGPLLAAFEARQVPDRAFIYRIFFGGRLP